MLKENQKRYLQTIPESKIVKIHLYDSRIEVIASEIISDIKKVTPELQVAYIGATALRISGQNDIDINVLTKSEQFGEYLPKLNGILGEPSSKGSIIEWGLSRESFEVTVYLTDANSEGIKEQIQIFNILKKNPKLLKEYEILKENFDGQPFREYQKQKVRIL